MGTEKIKRCVIITAGPMGEYSLLRGRIKPDDYIICVDGGADHLKGLSVTPHIIIGDLDSALKIPDGVEVLKFKSEKDETDTMLAVMHGLKMGFREFLLIGGLKGRLDHTFANLSTLQYIERHGAKGCFIDSDNEAYFVENSSMSFTKREGFYISVFPFGGDAVGVSEKGFKYKLDDAVMKTDFPNGVSNEFWADKGQISVKSGALLIIISKK
ncbi:MAG TPA: thiamine diphosphokinase [Ruminiclostridium sp.]|nr:thiamine diphosphokinase [Ruminiclostridium sp.]